jgi:hypothetical protein
MFNAIQEILSLLDKDTAQQAIEYANDFSKKELKKETKEAQENLAFQTSDEEFPELKEEAIQEALYFLNACLYATELQAVATKRQIGAFYF